MNRLANHYFLLCALIFSTLTIRADTLVLKDGTQIKGLILEESPDKVTIEYNATATIKDQKTIACSEIARIDKVPEDQQAYLDLGSLITPPVVIDSSFHDELVSRRIPDFIAKYPYSSHVGELRNRLKSLSEEHRRLERGDKRIDSVWISAEEIAADPYQNGARITFAMMGLPRISTNSVEYLRCFEKLEKSYPGSAVMPDAIDGALLQLDRLQSQIAAARVSGEIAMKNISVALAASRPDEAMEIKGGIARDNASSQIAMKAAATDGSKFFPVYQNNKEALDGLLAVAIAEKARLLQLKKIQMRDGIAAARECRRLLDQAKLMEARSQFDLSMKLWPGDIENERLKALLDQASKDDISKQKPQETPISKK